MSDDGFSEFSQLEQSLRASRPAALPAALKRQLEEVATESPSFAERLFVMWAGTGAVAACAVIAMAVWRFGQIEKRWAPALDAP